MGLALSGLSGLSGINSGGTLVTVTNQRFDLTAGAQDGFVGFNGVTPYPTSGTPDQIDTASNIIGVYSWLTGGLYYVKQGFIRFDTSAIPAGATITAGTLNVWPNSSGTTADSRQLCAQWYDPGTINAADYSFSPTNDAHTGTGIASLTAGAYKSLTLTGLTSVSTGGGAFTGFRLYVSGGAPSGQNNVDLRSYENAGNKPAYLTLSYTYIA